MAMAQWRMLTAGSCVWAPFGQWGWRPAIVAALGKNRAERTVVSLSFTNGGTGKRFATQLCWRKPELNGKDKPPRPGSEVLGK